MRWRSGKSSLFPNAGKSLTLLKVITIVSPVLFFFLLEVLRRTVFKEFLPTIWFNLSLFFIILVAAFFFSRLVFAVIDRLQRENLQRMQELAILNEVYRIVDESHNLNTLLKRAMHKLVQITAADCGELYLFNEQSHDLMHTLHVGLMEDVFKQETQSQLKERLMKEGTRLNQQVIMENLADFQGGLNLSLADMGILSSIIIPLRSRDTTSGIAYLFSTHPKHFKPDESDLLVDVGSRIAVAIERARLYNKVQAMAVLEERERISAELHDGLAQVLGYVITKSQATRQLLRKMATASDYLVELEKVAQEVYMDTREAILGLSTAISGDRNMVSALREYAVRFTQMNGIKTDLITIDDNVIPSLSPQIELQAIRIVQEALSNIRKHSGATSVKIQVAAEENEVTIAVEDDGKGFDVEKNGEEDWTKFGLRNMKERANSIKGTLLVESKPEAGTKITLGIPLTFSQTALEEGENEGIDSR